MHSHDYTSRTLLTTQLCDDRTCQPQIVRANFQKLSRWRKCTWIFELIFLNRKWIRNEDLISVLKRTESVQLWLKMFPTPKSGPSRHSLAATTSYIEILIILSYVCIGRLLRSPLSCLLYRWGFEQGCPRCQCRTPRCTGTSSWCLGPGTSGRSRPLLQRDLNSPRWDRGCYRLHQFLWSSPLSLDRHDPSWEMMDDNLKGHSLSPSV